MNKMPRLIPFGLALLLCGCGGTRENDPVVATTQTLDIALQEAVDYSVLPAVDGFMSEADELEAMAQQFCNAPGQSSLGLLQDQWRLLFNQWYRLASYNFGPLNDDLVFPTFTFIDSLRLRGTDYTETVRTEIADNIAGEHNLDNSFFASQTFQKVGLLALETSIFETASSDHSTSAADIVTDYQFSPRKCDVLLGLAEQMQIRASYVQNGWQQAFKNTDETYRELFLSGQLEDGSEPLSKLIVTVQEYLDYLQNRHVVTTAGQIANAAWPAIGAAADEVEQLLEGTEQSSVSFFSLMISTGNQGAVDTVRATIADLQQSISNQDEALLEISLAKLDGHFKREIPDSLEVDLGTNFTDGD